MGGFLPYLLVVIFFAAFVPLVMKGMQVRDPEAEADGNTSPE